MMELNVCFSYCFTLNISSETCICFQKTGGSFQTSKLLLGLSFLQVIQEEGTMFFPHESKCEFVRSKFGVDDTLRQSPV